MKQLLLGLIFLLLLLATTVVEPDSDCTTDSDCEGISDGQ